MTAVCRVSKKILIGDGQPLAIIAGPCVVENEEIVLRTAEKLKTISDKLELPLIFKSSYKKANRSSADSFVTIGMEKALRILEKVKNLFDLPILTDIHQEGEAKSVAEVSDIIQIPAFLCRQTNLIQAAARTGRALNIKKGQFMAPEDMALVAEKATRLGNPNLLLTERGTSFGYHNLVVDMRGLLIMQALGFPVVFDATHSAQLPGGAGEISGGQPEFAFPLAKAAIATGACAAIFIETHPNPKKALSDSKTQLPLNEMESILQQLKTLHQYICS
ncbi:MAG: 3-deoxy-8-phosphooctulonate synthase [Candidatus Cloacimonetes bacterium 4572_55]|nr:MAG: 3-deoxy-8-phosphooctulonate synthase [Candidatus Cloacimonetes bacterium 4572_55]